MALDLTTYAGLKAGVASYLNRRDLTDSIPAFIRQAEAKFNRELRVRDMQTRLEAAVSSAYIAVPADFLAPYSLELATMPQCWGAPIEFISEQRATEVRAQPTTGHTNWYTAFGSEFELLYAPASSITYRLKYYASVPALSDSVASNWLLVKSPDLYLVGACLEASVFLKNDERLTTWATIRQQIIDNMVLESERALRPQAALTAKAKSY